MSSFKFTTATNSFLFEKDGANQITKGSDTLEPQVAGSVVNSQTLYLKNRDGNILHTINLAANTPDTVDVDGTTVFANAAALALALQPLFFLASNGGGTGGGSAIGSWRLRSDTAMADPGSGNFRYNNADQTLATQMAVSENNRAGTDMSLAFGFINVGDLIYNQESSDATKAQLYEETGAVVDNTTWFLFNITHREQGTSPLDVNRDVGFVVIKPAATAALNFINQRTPDRMQVTNTSDWFLGVPAGEGKDVDNNGIIRHKFDDTVNQSVGWTDRIPVGATTLTITIDQRAEVTPPDALKVVGLDLHVRLVSPVGAFQAALALTDVAIPMDDDFHQYQVTVLLTDFATNLIAGNTYQYELVRRATSGDTLVNDWVTELYESNYTN